MDNQDNSRSNDEIDDLLDNPRSQQEALEKQRDIINKMFSAVFHTPEGGKLLGYLSLRFYAGPCFDPNNPDPYKAAVRDGERNVVKFIIDQLSSAQQ